MQRAMAENSRRPAPARLPRFQMGNGNNTGAAVVGNIGSEQRAKYTVVGSAVNVAARVEGATVGGQIFITAATYEAIRDIAHVDAPVFAQMKGLTEPLALYELHALDGRFAQPAAPVDAEPDAAVPLPITCWRIDGKIVSADALSGTAVRIGRQGATVRLDADLPALTNVRLRIRYPDGAASGDIYGKVATTPSNVPPSSDGAGAIIRIHFTSLTDEDADALDRLVAACAGAAEAGSPA
jgi:adenylate cyclase